MSEIDNIFGAKKGKSKAGPSISAAKGKGKAKDGSVQQPAAAPPTTTTKKMRKKRKHEEATDHQDASQDESQQKKSAATKQPETILDPSAVLAAEAKSQPRPKKPKSKSKGASSSSAAPPDADDLDDFTNSKGSRRSRTEEGFAIYSESELKLGKGGETPLCPFDCTCCF